MQYVFISKLKLRKMQEETNIIFVFVSLTVSYFLCFHINQTKL